MYGGFIAWTLFGTNPLMLMHAYTCDDGPKTDARTAVMALVMTTATCAIGAACAYTQRKTRGLALHDDGATMAVDHGSLLVHDHSTANGSPDLFKISLYIENGYLGNIYIHIACDMV